MRHVDKTLRETPSQTAGPYVHIGLMPQHAGLEVLPDDLGQIIASSTVPGHRITVSGCIFDGLGVPVTDALIEVWQADSTGTYPGQGAVPEGFHGWGRYAPDVESGVYSFQTIKPGTVIQPDARVAAPHLNIWLIARGINIGLHTRLYFDDEVSANANDPVLAQVSDTSRQSTLIAMGNGTDYRFDIRLQGDGETVFLDF
ncbi:MAG: protocatechuate 3,4-dioxygenase subunit alpha [Roseobacter sp.]